MAINFKKISSQYNQNNSLDSNIPLQFNNFANQGSTVTQQVTRVSNQSNNLLNSTQSNLNIPSQLLKEPLSAVANNLDIALDENLNQYQKSINQTISSIDPDLSFHLPEIVSVGTEVATGINQITNQIDGSIDDFASSLGKVTNQIADNFSQQYGQLDSTLNNLTKSITGFSSSILNFDNLLSNAILKLPGDFGEITSSVLGFNDKLQGGLDKLQNTIGDGSEITNVIENPGQFIQNKVKDIIDSGLERILGPINELANLGSSLANQILGSNTINVLSGAIESVTQNIDSLFVDALESFDDRFLSTDLLLSSGTLLSGNSSLIGGADFSSGPDNSSKFGSSKVPNPLRNHNMYNYVLSLGCIDKQTYLLGSYKDDGLGEIIVTSGGGNYDKRVTTSDEDKLGADLEYFIEDLEIDAVIAPNQNTGISFGTTIRFKIIEPYSMGQLIEALKVTAINQGYKNYINAIFCLKIDFIGWDQYGKNTKRYVEKPIYIPIKLLKMDFSVTESGTVYECEAISFSEAATDDNVMRTKTQIKSSGKTVADVLENNNNSITAVINDHIEQLEINGDIPKGDRYLIMFPKNRNELYKMVNSVSVSKMFESSLSSNIDDRRSAITRGDKAAVEDYPGAPPIYQRLKLYAQQPSMMNAIGKATLKSNINSNTNQPTSDPIETINNGMHNPGIKDSEPRKNEKGYDYGKNESIIEIIEDVVLDSSYIQGVIDGLINGNQSDNTFGKISWFRVEAFTFPEELPAAEEKMGRTINTYVYAVFVSLIDESKFLGPNGKPKGTQSLKERAVKSYNYYYTGQNEDVIDFDINFNMAFYNAISSDLHLTRTDNSDNIAGTQDPEKYEAKRRSADQNQEATIASQVTELRSRSLRGSILEKDSEAKRRLAEDIHNRIINSPVDMITAEMEIWGDPYFIPNYQGVTSPGRSESNINSDGTMNYTDNEVMVVVNFRTPLDYQINGFVMNFPELVKPFSGLFMVWAVTNVFSEGKYTQNLKLIRRSGQTEEGKDNGFKLKNKTSLTGGNAGIGAARSGIFGDGLRGSSLVDETDDLRAAATAAASARGVSTRTGDDILFQQKVVSNPTQNFTPNRSIDSVSAAQSFDAKAEATRIRNPNFRGKGIQ